jgi:hypothetical protein
MQTTTAHRWHQCPPATAYAHASRCPRNPMPRALNTGQLPALPRRRATLPRRRATLPRRRHQCPPSPMPARPARPHGPRHARPTPRTTHATHGPRHARPTPRTTHTTNDHANHHRRQRQPRRQRRQQPPRNGCRRHETQPPITKRCSCKRVPYERPRSQDTRRETTAFRSYTNRRPMRVSHGS